MALSLERKISIPENNPLPVSARAKLGSLNLGFLGSPTRDKTHALHPYVAAINPPLARALIEEYVERNAPILDPFVGGGGVVVEAKWLGHPSVGIDTNPLAEIISKAKTTHMSIRILSNEINRVLNEATELVRCNPNESVDSMISYWYKPESCVQLGALSKAVRRQRDISIRNTCLTILSAVARDVMLTYRGEVRLRRLQGRDLENFHPDAIESFKRRSTMAIDRIPQIPIQPSTEIINGSVMDIPFDDDSFNAIICSPPYGDDKNGVGYLQFSRNMLYWLGYKLDDISLYKKRFLGAEPQIPRDWNPDIFPSIKWSLLKVGERSEQQYNEALAFYSDYYKGLREMVRVTQKFIVIVIGDRVLSRTFFDNGRITMEFMENLGAPLHHYFKREIKKKRIPNLGSDGGGIAVEHVLVFEKS